MTKYCDDDLWIVQGRSGCLYWHTLGIYTDERLANNRLVNVRRGGEYDQVVIETEKLNTEICI